MTAKEYYNNQDRFEYFTKLTNTGISDDFDEIMAFAEAYCEYKLKLLGKADVRLSFLEEVRAKWSESDSVEFDEWLYDQLNED